MLDILKEQNKKDREKKNFNPIPEREFKNKDFDLNFVKQKFLQKLQIHENIEDLFIKKEISEEEANERSSINISSPKSSFSQKYKKSLKDRIPGFENMFIHTSNRRFKSFGSPQYKSKLNKRERFNSDIDMNVKPCENKFDLNDKIEENKQNGGEIKKPAISNLLPRKSLQDQEKATYDKTAIKKHKISLDITDSNKENKKESDKVLENEIVFILKNWDLKKLDFKNSLVFQREDPIPSEIIIRAVLRFMNITKNMKEEILKYIEKYPEVKKKFSIDKVRHGLFPHLTKSMMEVYEAIKDQKYQQRASFFKLIKNLPNDLILEIEKLINVKDKRITQILTDTTKSDLLKKEDLKNLAISIKKSIFYYNLLRKK